MTALATEILEALRALEAKHVPHDCGGFTIDDMRWRMAKVFVPDGEMYDAIQELSDAGLLRYSGHDEKDAIGSCYELKGGAS